MRGWDADRIAEAAGAAVVSGAPAGPVRAVIDSREVRPGDLFVGLRGENVDGGCFAAAALEAGAWGVLVAPGHAPPAGDGAVLTAPDPLVALQRLATAWRRALGAAVVGITGSTGKTTTKDLLAEICSPSRTTVATAQNLNTEIGLPLTVLCAPPGTEVLILEMAMRGAGQIAELTAIAEPDVGVIVNVGPVHLELLGTVEAIAAAKAELIAGLRPGATAVVPAGEPLLDPHLRDDLVIVRYEDGDLGFELTVHGGPPAVYLRRNAQAAVAAARAIGVEPPARVDARLSALRGQRNLVPGGVLVIDDCYNANPMSMRAALDDLAATAAGQRVAVLGDMLELGPEERRFHEAVGEYARARGVDLLVTVGPRAEAMHGDRHVPDAAAAAELVPTLVRDGDTVLIKASRGVGLELVGRALRGED